MTTATTPPDEAEMAEIEEIRRFAVASSSRMYRLAAVVERRGNAAALAAARDGAAEAARLARAAASALKEAPDE